MTCGDLEQEMGREKFLRRNYITMLVSWMILAPTWTITAPYFQHFILALNGNEYIVGLIGALSSYTLAIVRIIGGYLTDTIGRKKIIVVFTFILSITYLLFYIAWDWKIVLIASIVSSLALIYQPALSAIIADSLPSRLRGKGFGLIQLTNGLTGLGAIYLAIFLVTNYGIVSGVRIGYLVSFVLILIAFFIRWMFLTETITPKDVQLNNVLNDFISQYQGSLSWIKDKLLGIIIVIIIFNFVTGLVYLTPLYITYFLEFGLEIWGYYSMLVSGFQLLMALPIGFMVDKIGRKKVLLSSFISYSISFTLLLELGYNNFIVSKFATLIIAGFAAGIAGSMWSLSVQSLIADLTIPSIRGKISAINGFIANSALSTGQLVSGYVYNLFGPQYIYLYSIVISIFVTPLGAFIINEK